MARKKQENLKNDKARKKILKEEKKINKNQTKEKKFLEVVHVHVINIPAHLYLNATFIVLRNNVCFLSLNTVCCNCQLTCLLKS